MDVVAAQSDTVRKSLVTAYIAEDQGRERQHFHLRIPVRGRKLVVAGCFDRARSDELAASIFAAIRNAAIAEG